MEEGAVMMTGLVWDHLQQAMKILKSQPRGGQHLLRLVPDYNVPNVSEKVVRIILSYTGYINCVVWQKA